MAGDKRGANTKRTPEVRAAILGFLEEGCTRSMAFYCAGVGHDFFYSWMRDDAEFSDDVKRAEAAYLATRIRKVNTADAWQASAWMLERRDPENFALTDQIEKVLKKHGLINDGDKPGQSGQANESTTEAG